MAVRSTRARGATRAPMVVAVSVIAVAVILGAVAFRPLGRPSTASAQPMAQLVAALGERRVTVGRLTGGFRHATLSTRRGVSAAVAPDVAIAAATAEKHLAEVQDASHLEVAGVARLIMGDTSRAVEALLEATRARPDCGSCWSNLAAAHLERSLQPGPLAAGSLIPALDAGERAVAIAPNLREAWFNLALVRDLLGYGANTAWRTYISLDDDRSWRAEGDAHLTANLIDQERAESLDAFARAPDAELMEFCQKRPGVARVYVEDLLLGQWGDGVLSADRVETMRLEARLNMVARCLVREGRDALLLATLAAIPSGGDESIVRRYAALFRAYRTGRQLSEQARETEAVPQLKRALATARELDSPFRWLVEFRLATVDYQARKLSRAQAKLVRVVDLARAKGYLSLEVRATILSGTVFMQLGRLRESHNAYTDAASRVSIDADADLAATAAYSLANTARLVGDSPRGWRALVPVLAQLDRVDDPRRRLMVLYNASLLAEHEGQLFAAMHFQNGALETAIVRGVPGSIVEARTRRAFLAYRLGLASAAAADLQAADATLATITEPLRAIYYKGLLDAVMGRTLVQSDPHRAVVHLARAIDYFARAEPVDLPSLYLARGRANMAAGIRSAASADFKAGITALETLRERISDRGDRLSLFDTGWELFDEMVAMSADNSETAFEYAERGRARGLLEALGGPAIAADVKTIESHIPDGVTLLHYAPLKRETLIWIVRRDGTQFRRLPIPAERVSFEARRYVDALRAGGPAERDASLALYDLLLKPIAGFLRRDDTLVVVGDAVITSIPFAALSPSDGRRLVDEFSIAYAPSARVFLRALSLKPRKQLRAGLRLLAVGNPMIDRDRHIQLRPLPGAEREVAHIAGLYLRSTVLVGAEATKRRFLDELPSADVVHVGTHTLVDEEYPSETVLVFAPDKADAIDTVTIKELTSQHREAPAVAVLAACATSQGTPFRLEGVVSLARAFLELGTPEVVATLWDVEDTSAAVLFAALHEELARGAGAAHALRSAQLSFLHGPDAKMRAPSHWAAYVAMGAAASDRWSKRSVH